MPLRIGGIASGIDTEAIIEAMLSPKQLQVTVMEAEITDDVEKYSAWSQVKTKISDLQSVTEQLDNYSTWRQMSASAKDLSGSSSTAVGASAGISAQAGTYDINVTNLAQEHRIASDAQSDATSDLNLTGDFSVGGETINVVATDSLTDVRNSINDAASSMDDDEKVRAYIIDSTLVIERVETGATDISLVDGTNNILQSGAGGLGFFSGTVAVPNATLKNELQPAEDMSATVNSIAVSGSDNTNLTGIISGVTLSFYEEEASTLTVEADTATVKSLITDFISKYNETMSIANEAGTVVLSSNEENINGLGILQGEFLLADIQTKARNFVTSSESNPNIMDQDFNSLYTIGIWFEGEANELSIVDEEALDNALANNFEEVEDLFRDNTSGVMKQLDEYLYSLIDPIEGSVTKRELSLQTDMSNTRQDIVDLKSDMLMEEEDLWEHFANMENMVSNITNQWSYVASSLGL